MKTRKIVILVGMGLALGFLISACAQLNPNTDGQILSALEAKQDAFKACYVTALERDRETQGTVGLLLDIENPSGQVTSSAVEESNITDDEMNQCVAGAAGDISLPEPPGVPVEGHYDVQFGFE
ncbi:MAG: AgmX/PglI C-terminal domain-containing protein [Proteobacteria bacterium]|nr:AgmX/PglI C-terminal domain-containing protein [Pseudomonadota bacterium]